MTQQNAMPRARLDFLVPLLMAGMLLGSCLLASRQKPFWFDEILTYYFVTDPSVSHMLEAAEDLINASPPLYFLLARLWTRVFGTTELAFRMLSSVGCVTGCSVIWWLLRRTYGSWPAAVAAIAVLMSSRHLLFNNAEARYYGVLFAELALAVWVYAQLCRQTRPRVGILLANAAVHAALVTTHYFGLFYSATLLAANCWFHRKESRRFLAFFLSALLGWVAFLPCLPAFFRHQQFGGPYGWLGRPTVMDLVRLFTTNDEMVGLVALTFTGLAILVQQSSKGATNLNAADVGADADYPGIRALLILATCLATLPGGIWIYSYLAGPVFLDRYLWPVVVMAWCIVVAHGTWRILRDSRLSSDTAADRRAGRAVALVPRFALGLLCLVCLIVPLQTHFHAPAALGDFLQRFSDLRPALPRGVPVVFEDPLKFLECKFYYDSDHRYFVLLDKDWALSTDKETLRPNLFAVGSALQRQYSVNAITPNEFLARHDTFAFVPTHGELFDKWIRSSGEYSWTRTNRGRGYTHVVVTRGG